MKTKSLHELDVYVSGDHPATCPKCGARTEFIEVDDMKQQHKCLGCKYEFFMDEPDEDLTVKEFKAEFRQMTCDTWGDAIEAHFELAGQLYDRDIDIPPQWEYKPAATTDKYNFILPKQAEPDSYFHEMFANATTESLQKIGAFLFRYCEHLRFKGINY